MSLLDSFKLEKLKILAFTNPERTDRAENPEFEAMFNPESFKQRYGIRYGPARGAGATDDASVYIRSDPSELQLELLLDGTGVTDVIALPPGPAAKTVTERVDAFLATAFEFVGETHQPPYLQVQWGDLWNSSGFNCRLVSAEVSYTRFGRDGKPLRAKLDVTLRSDASWEEQIRRNNPSSPDLTHRRTVIAGDTLLRLTEQIYGSAAHVLMVARFNKLNDIRFIEPGTELVFPPLPGRGKQSTGAR